MLLSVIPSGFELPGLYLIACLISMAMGTSVGSITVLTPIAVAVAANGVPLPFCVGAVVGGSMFGDNLSFISDTTIAATKTQGVAMKDKFRTNFMLALPAAIITFVILVVGLITGSLVYSSALSSMGEGISGMFETMIVTILVASITALIKNNGGFEVILQLIRKKANTKRGEMFGISALTAFLDVATANNTVAIVVAAPIAKEIGDEYEIEPRKVASLLDISSCIVQGIIPYGAQLLVASSIARMPSLSFVPFLIYPFILAVVVILSITFEKKR